VDDWQHFYQGSELWYLLGIVLMKAQEIYKPHFPRRFICTSGSEELVICGVIQWEVCNVKVVTHPANEHLHI